MKHKNLIRESMQRISLGDKSMKLARELFCSDFDNYKDEFEFRDKTIEVSVKIKK